MLCIEELLNVDDEVKRRVERQFDCFCKRVMTQLARHDVASLFTVAATER